ncbi:hypothetical protein VPNG_08381 [Cytospora leucostoma]|uniref:Chitin-binding type-4 domain-containing protein n=1 Tax=Cytospora leucostoma TaxID=1230097 RepID=A0A423W661_9PEZI|nr:hypothetical protein VPNG_08381 [Cytospora leucostoma]
MTWFTTTVASALALSGMCSAHMILANPKPYGDPDNSPLTSSNYPCQISGDASTFYSTDGLSNTVAAGESLTMSFTGSAVHGGGSCQVALTTDMQPSKTTRWSVILSIEGGCPTKDGTTASTYDVKIPSDIAAGTYSYAWTWTSKLSGTQEYYMNCAPLTVTSGSSKRSTDISPRSDSLDNYPPLAVYNLAELNSCKSELSSSPLYPYPGSTVEHLAEGEPAYANITGTDCFATGAAEATTAAATAAAATSSASGFLTSVVAATSSAAAAATTQAATSAAAAAAAATAAASEPLVELGLVAGSYYNDIGTPHSFPYVLPFFLEMLHIVVNIEPPEKVCHDLSLMKRLLAAFEGNPERHTIMEDLRQDCRRDMSALFGVIQRAKWEVIKKVPKAFKGRGVFKSTVPSTTSLKRRAKINIQGAVERFQKVAAESVEEYHNLSLLISTLDARLLETRADLECAMARVVFKVLENVAVGKAEAWSQNWVQMKATNAWMYSGLDELGSKLAEMQGCLNDWKADYLQALNEVSGQEIPEQDSRPQGIISHFKLEYNDQRETRKTLSDLELEQGDLREAQRSLAVRRSLEPHSGQQRLEEARQRFRLRTIARLFTQ